MSLLVYTCAYIHIYIYTGYIRAFRRGLFGVVIALRAREDPFLAFGVREWPTEEHRIHSCFAYKIAVIWGVPKIGGPKIDADILCPMILVIGAPHCGS